jgi:ketosteroid isomerase-like protein
MTRCGSDALLRIHRTGFIAVSSLPLVLLGLASGCGPGGTPAQGNDLHPSSDTPSLAGDPGATAELEALIDDWVEMWNSYDLNQVRELFLDDSRLTYFSSEKQGILRGMDALITHHEGFGFIPGGDDRSSRLWLESVEIDLLGEVAVITGTWFFQSDSDSPGEPQKGPVTIVSVREGDRWWFVHMNFSEYLPEEGS